MNVRTTVPKSDALARYPGLHDAPELLKRDRVPLRGAVIRAPQNVGRKFFRCFIDDVQHSEERAIVIAICAQSGFRFAHSNVDSRSASRDTTTSTVSVPKHHDVNSQRPKTPQHHTKITFQNRS